MPQDASLLREIEERHSFSLPSEYKVMYENGWLDFDRTRRDQPQPYLWLNEMEWMPLQRIVQFKFPHDCTDHFVPFAVTGGGDHWCWYPRYTVGGATPVVNCPRDSVMGAFYAADFVGALYRQILEFAHCWGRSWDEEMEGRSHLTRWVHDLGPFFRPQWRETLTTLRSSGLKEWDHGSQRLRGLLLPQEYRAIVQRDLAFDKLDEEFRWVEE